MKFLYVVHDSFPHIFTVGIYIIMSMKGEILIAHRQWDGDFNPVSFSLTLGNPLRAIKGKA